MARREPETGPVRRWLREQRPDDLHLSAITIGEIAHGIALVRPRDPSFAAALTVWLRRLRADFADRILPVGPAEAQRWGELAAAMGHADLDLLIAATALERGLVVVTRNTRHFTPTGVVVLEV